VKTAIYYIKYANEKFIHTFNGILCILKLHALSIALKMQQTGFALRGMYTGNGKLRLL
jgi:hypothetical protein